MHCGPALYQFALQFQGPFFGSELKLISCVNTRLVLVVLLAGATSSKKHKALSTLAIIVADFGDVIFYRIRRQSPKNRRRRQIVTENGDSRRIDCRQIRRL